LPKFRGAALSAVLFALAFAPAAHADVTVRVEGSSTTLVDAAAGATGPAVVKDGINSCAGNTGAGALERATGGDWAGTWFDGMGYQVDSVRGESHTGATSEWWNYWVNYRPSDSGICDTPLQDGDEHLLFPDCFGAGCVNPTVLKLEAPRRSRPGEPFTVTVKRVVVAYEPDWTQTISEEPAAGVTVGAAGASATTDTQGRATVTVAARGPVAVRASRANHVRDSQTVCVTDGADGSCGTTAPGGPPAGEPPCETDGADGRCGTADRRAPLGRLLGLETGRTYTRKQAPRLLRGVVAQDPSGIASVTLRIVRRHKGRCWTLSTDHDRLVRMRCGGRRWNAIGDRAEWSYLLPRKLPRGRYRIAVRATDRAGNRERAETGRNRVFLRVR
jgi:hypothetical protein